MRHHKSFWRERDSDLWSFLCPLCKAARKVPFRPRPGGLKHVSRVVLCSVFFMLLTWHWFTWKGIVSLVPFWTVFEVFYRARVRGALSCPHCGFDPYLYLTDVKRARQEIESHWRRKFTERGLEYPPPSSPKPRENTLVGRS